MSNDILGLNAMPTVSALGRKEITLYQLAFVPGGIPEDVVVRCANCSLVDEDRRGHTPGDCRRALMQEVERLQLENLSLRESLSFSLPQQRS